MLPDTKHPGETDEDHLHFFADYEPPTDDFLTDVVEGLSHAQKTLSPKYFYDEAGSKLFDQITELDEYYPTRTEKQVFLDNAAEITQSIGAGAAIFEYGSGSSEKVEWLVGGLKDPVAYVAMESPTRSRQGRSLTRSLSLAVQRPTPLPVGRRRLVCLSNLEVLSAVRATHEGPATQGVSRVLWKAERKAAS